MSDNRRDNKNRVLRTGEVQRKDGKYMFRYVDATGSRRTLYSWRLVSTDKLPAGKRDSGALRDQEKKALRDTDDGIKTSIAKKRTVDVQFDEFLKVRSDLSDSSVFIYSTVYANHIKDTIGERRIGDVKHSDVKRLYTQLIKDGLSGSTIHITNIVMYQIFELAVKDEFIRNNPAKGVYKDITKSAKTKRKERHALTVGQQTAFVNYVCNSPIYKKYANLIVVLLGTGMRIGEALGLRWDDCNFDNNIISVTHNLLYLPSCNGGYTNRISKPKTAAGNRIIPMLPDVRRALLDLKERNKEFDIGYSIDGYSNFVFINSKGRVYNQTNIFGVLKQIVCSYNKEEELAAEEDCREPEPLPQISAHILRHTFCTRFCENETNIKVIQEIMGHSRIQTTMDIYNEATRDKKEECMKNLAANMVIAPSAPF